MATIRRPIVGSCIPTKKQKDFETPKKNRDRGRGRDRTLSKSRESEDTRVKKKGRDQSPHTSKTLGRVLTEKPADSDRDTDESSDDQEDLKKAERILQKAQEQVEKEKKRVAKKARRIKTTAASGIFQDEDLEAQLVNLKRRKL